MVCPHFDQFYLLFGTCTCCLTKYFVILLKELTANDYTICDLFSFCNKIQKQDETLYMAPFDTDVSLDVGANLSQF